MIDRRLNYGRHHVRAFAGRLRDLSTVLDLGAGSGADLELVRQAHPRAALHGVEMHPPAVEELRSRGVVTHALDLERDALPFDDGVVDLVIANQVLEHVKEIFWITHQISRVLQVGGHFLIGVPNLASLHNRLLLMAGRQPTAIQTASAHVRGYTRHDLLRFLETVFSGGYREIARGGSNFYPFPPLLARPLARLAPGMAWGLFLLLRKEREYGGEIREFPVRKGLETNFHTGPTAEE
jgi:methionine biosynthesis protein MetW